jgi:UPF0042 nucleotide-binding protein
MRMADREEMVRVLIVTGQSGAGKTSVIRNLEDWDFFCVDNLPPALLPRTAEMCRDAHVAQRIALVVDIRSRSFFEQIVPAIQEIDRLGFQCEVLFLEASTEALIKRFKETRRRHPLSSEGHLTEDILRERNLLKDLFEKADMVVDTSDLDVRGLKTVLEQRLNLNEEWKFMIQLVSFGYKHGIPLDADLVVDVRFLPNPFYDPDMRNQTGLDRQVRDYVLNNPAAQEFCRLYLELLNFLIPNYIQEGKTQLVLAVGCTGGQHRSVALAERIGNALNVPGRRAKISHRDIEKIKERKDG